MCNGLSADKWTWKAQDLFKCQPSMLPLGPIREDNFATGKMTNLISWIWSILLLLGSSETMFSQFFLFHDKLVIFAVHQNREVFWGIFSPRFCPFYFQKFLARWQKVNEEIWVQKCIHFYVLKSEAAPQSIWQHKQLHWMSKENQTLKFSEALSLEISTHWCYYSVYCFARAGQSSQSSTYF